MSKKNWMEFVFVYIRWVVYMCPFCWKCASSNWCTCTVCWPVGPSLCFGCAGRDQKLVGGSSGGREGCVEVLLGSWHVRRWKTGHSSESFWSRGGGFLARLPLIFKKNKQNLKKQQCVCVYWLFLETIVPYFVSSIFEAFFLSCGWQQVSNWPPPDVLMAP